MNTNALLSLVLAGGWACIGAFGQATFRLQNHLLAYGIDAPVYDWNGNPLGGQEWRVELYGGATQSSLSPVIYPPDGGRVTLPFAVPGYFTDYHTLAVFEVPEGGWAWLQVKVWDVTLGTTYEEALARGLGGYGASALFYARGGGEGSTPTPPAPLIGLQSFSVLQPVPEPSAWALLALGGLGLWWATRRRRNSQP